MSENKKQKLWQSEKGGGLNPLVTEYIVSDEMNTDAFLFNGTTRKFFRQETITNQMSKANFEIISINDRIVKYHPYDNDFKSTFLEVIARKTKSLIV